MCTLQILYLSKEQFVDGIFALLPNPISPRLWATRCFMWRGLDIKVTWLQNALLLFVELYVPKPDRLSLRLLVICSWICCHYSTLNKAAPHSQAMKCNSLTFLFIFFYLFFSFGLGDYLLFGNDLQTSTVQWHPENIKLYLPHMCHYRATSGFSIWQPLLQVHIVASPECLRGFFVILISVSCTINNTLLYYLVQSVTLVLDQL